MSRRATLPALAAAAVLLLGACTGSSEATRGSVEDDVRGRLDDLDPPITGSEADVIAECISAGLFDPERFTEDERNEATSAPDGDVPDADLTDRVVALDAECKADGAAVEDEADADADEDADDDSTTTTDG